MSLFKRADPKAFEQTILPLERQVYFTCLQLMGNKEDAEDCAQEALLKAYRKFDSFKGQSKFSTWLYTLVTRVCLDALRRRKEVFSLVAMFDEGYEPPSEQAEAYLLLEEKERKRLLQLALKEVPADFRMAVVLVDLQGLSYQEAAQVLTLPEGTVKSRLYRGRKILQASLLKNRELFTDARRLNDERRESHGVQ